MAVFRVNKTGDYTVISNTHFKEKNMSLKAKGLLSLMLSLPDNWDYSVNGLASLSKDGKDSVMNTLTELEQFGYLKRTKNVDSYGRFAGYDYDIFEKPNTETPYPGNPNTEKPNTENPPQLNTKPLTTNLSIPKQSNTKRRNFVPPTLADIEDYCMERNNHVDPKKFYDYFSASGWIDGKGNPVRNWKQKVITWESYARPEKTQTRKNSNVFLDMLEDEL